MKFIFTADWHIRPDRPRCRVDEDWLKTQREQVQFVKKISKERGCPIILGGDLFHKSQVPDSLKSMLIEELHDVFFYAIGGNHDWPYHSMENISNSSFGVLAKARLITPIPQEIGRYKHYGHHLSGGNKDVVFIHEPIFASEKDCPPNMKAKTAVQVFDEHPEAKWILCGDVHRGFHVKKQGRHLIMAGALNRQASDYSDYQPKIWYIDIEKDFVEEILVPDDVNLVTDEHIQVKNEREDRIAAFVSLIKSSKKVSLDFESNVRAAISESKDLDEDTINMIEELMI